MSSLKLHDMRIGTVDNSRIHHRFARIRFLFENVHCQLQYFISIGRINESRVQYTIEHEFQTISLTRQGVNAYKNHFFFPSGFFGSLISSRSYSVIMRIHSINLRVTSKHTVHFYFCRPTLPSRICFINQLYLGKMTDSSHKSLMTFHGGSRAT